MGIYYPVTDGGTPIYVHSKVMVIDDRLLRIGSSNLNNRSMGFDSECDVADRGGLNVRDDDVRRQITSLRNQLVSEHLGVSVDELRERGGSDRLVSAGRRGTSRRRQDVAALHRADGAGEASPLAENDLMDPDHVPRSLARSVQRFIAGLRR